MDGRRALLLGTSCKSARSVVVEVPVTRTRPCDDLRGKDRSVTSGGHPKLRGLHPSLERLTVTRAGSRRAGHIGVGDGDHLHEGKHEADQSFSKSSSAPVVPCAAPKHAERRLRLLRQNDPLPARRMMSVGRIAIPLSASGAPLHFKPPLSVDIAATRGELADKTSFRHPVRMVGEDG